MILTHIYERICNYETVTWIFMKTAGIIAEYNPFHNGHEYHLAETRMQTGADYLVVIMSGDYVQRGEPAIFNKYLRTRTALMAGANLVLELPVFGAVSSAADFAGCAVGSLEKSGLVDILSFGSECGNLNFLKSQAEYTDTETEEISILIRQGLKKGLSWPMARAAAYETAGYGTISSSPNDILGTEYLKALKTLHSSMEPFPITRTDPGYHSKNRIGSFASATAARKAIEENDPDFLMEILPDFFFSCFEKEGCPAVTFDDFSAVLNEKLLNSSLKQLEDTSGMPKDLAAKLYKNRLRFLPARKLTKASKDRQYTYTRVSRSLLNFALGITKQELSAFKELGMCPWLRILGFKKDSALLLTKLKKNSDIPIITKTADASSILSGEALRLFEKHLLTSELYRMICEIKTGKSTKNEFTRSVILL